MNSRVPLDPLPSGLVTRLIPSMARRTAAGFDVFEVMHHGTHEKQLSNVFAWLLDANGTHELGDAFQRIFVDLVNQSLTPHPRVVSDSPLSVRQEVNTLPDFEGMDIADVVLENDEVSFVIENYYTSDGHGHSYANYLKFGAKGDKRSVVVMLCEHETPAALADGWENAALVTYGSLVARLHDHVETDPRYRQRFPEQCMFFDHMFRRFAGGTVMTDNDSLLALIDVMCQSDLAEEYGAKQQDAVAIRVGDRVRDEAIQQFTESRALLQRVKQNLRIYGTKHLRDQVNDALGKERITNVAIPWAGKWQWTVILHSSNQAENAAAYIAFGPSAWAWLDDVAPEGRVAQPNYTRLFIADSRSERMAQSHVSLSEVLDGLAPDDYRLRDDVLDMLRAEEQ